MSKNYYYEIKANSDQWWWQPLPQFVIDNLTDTEIRNIISMSDSDLVKYHNSLTREGFGDMHHKALIWVAQGESWRRDFVATSVKATVKRQDGKYKR